MYAAMLFAAVMILSLGWHNTLVVWSFQHSMIHHMLLSESLFFIFLWSVISVQIIVFEFAELSSVSRILISGLFLCINSSLQQTKLFSLNLG